MPAPMISATRGTITLTLDAVPCRGFEIRGTATQTAIGADWTVALSIVKVDLPTIADADETATHTQNTRVPANEAPSESAILAKMQLMVDFIFDHIVPTP